MTSKINDLDLTFTWPWWPTSDMESASFHMVKRLKTHKKIANARLMRADIYAKSRVRPNMASGSRSQVKGHLGQGYEILRVGVKLINLMVLFRCDRALFVRVIHEKQRRVLPSVFNAVIQFLQNMRTHMQHVRNNYQKVYEQRRNTAPIFIDIANTLRMASYVALGTYM